MADLLTIHRVGNPWLERAIRVTQGSREWWINPQTQVQRICGVHYRPSNHGRIMSFAEGLVDAGHTVSIDDRRQGKPPRTFLVERGQSSLNVHCYLFGRAWGSNQWESLKTTMENLIYQSGWEQVFNFTAQYYYHHQWEKEIHLHIPR